MNSIPASLLLYLLSSSFLFSHPSSTSVSKFWPVKSTSFSFPFISLHLGDDPRRDLFDRVGFPDPAHVFLKGKVFGFVVERPQCLVLLGVGVMLQELGDEVFSFLGRGGGREGGRVGEWVNVCSLLIVPLPPSLPPSLPLVSSGS